MKNEIQSVFFLQLNDQKKIWCIIAIVFLFFHHWKNHGNKFGRLGRGSSLLEVTRRKKSEEVGSGFDIKSKFFNLAWKS
jgi:hypothetical protein